MSLVSYYETHILLFCSFLIFLGSSLILKEKLDFNGKSLLTAELSGKGDSSCGFR
jgi:hypothetical protein